MEKKGREEGRKEGEKERGGREGGREERKKEQTMEITGLIKYDDSDVLMFLQIWMLFFFFFKQNLQSLLHLPSSWEPYKG